MIDQKLIALNRLVSCWPIAFEWNPNLDGKCVDQISLFTAALATDVITDGESILSKTLCGHDSTRRIMQA